MNDQLSQWQSLIPTLVGGAITLLAALLAFSLSHWAERKRRQEEEKKKISANALSGVHKLILWADLIANIKNHVGKFYEQANEFGLVPDDACLIVGPSVGIFVEPTRLEIAEYAFLLNKEHSGLAQDILLMERKAINTHFLFEKYSQMREEFNQWLDDVPGFQISLDGPIASSKLPSKYKQNYDVRVAQLNRLLAGLVEDLDGDVDEARLLTQQFADAAHDLFEGGFPKVEIG